jgi:hypothetical protein
MPRWSLVSRPHRGHPREGARRASDTGRDGLNDSDPLYEQDLELTLSKEGDAYLGLITLDVERA